MEAAGGGPSFSAISAAHGLRIGKVLVYKISSLCSKPTDALCWLYCVVEWRFDGIYNWKFCLPFAFYDCVFGDNVFSFSPKLNNPG